MPKKPALSPQVFAHTLCLEHCELHWPHLLANTKAAFMSPFGICLPLDSLFDHPPQPHLWKSGFTAFSMYSVLCMSKITTKSYLCHKTVEFPKDKILFTFFHSWGSVQALEHNTCSKMDLLVVQASWRYCGLSSRPQQ